MISLITNLTPTQGGDSERMLTLTSGPAKCLGNNNTFLAGSCWRACFYLESSQAPETLGNSGISLRGNLHSHDNSEDTP